MLSGFRSLLRHTAVYGAGDFLGRAVSVVLLPLYARRLTTGENGIMVLAFAFIGFTAAVYSFGLNQALVRYLSVREDGALLKTRLSTVFWSLLAVGGGLSTLLWLQAANVSRLLLGTPDYAGILELIAVIVFLDTLSEPLFSYFRARQRSTLYSALRLCQHTIQIGLTVYLILARGEGVRAVFIGNVVSSSFALIAIGVFSIGQLSLTYSVREIRRLLAFGVPFVPSAIAMLAINLSDRFLVRHFLGIDEAGVYGVAYKLTLPLALIVRSFRSAWAPAVLAEEKREGRELTARVTTYVALGGVGVFLLATAFAGDLIRLVSGANSETYIAGLTVVPLVSFGFVLYGLYVVLTAGVYVESRTGMLPFIIAVGASINIGLNVYLIPSIGISGAAWSTIGAYGAMTLLLHVYTRRIYPVSFEYRRLFKIFVAGGLCTLLIVNNIDNPSFSAALARCCFAAAFPLFLKMWGFFLPGEWHGLRSLLRRSPGDPRSLTAVPPETT